MRVRKATMQTLSAAVNKDSATTEGVKVTIEIVQLGWDSKVSASGRLSKYQLIQLARAAKEGLEAIEVTEARSLQFTRDHLAALGAR